MITGKGVGVAGAARIAMYMNQLAPEKNVVQCGNI